ncbi:YqaA family protein [Pantoea ananatis]|uniref:YqaA family protein n=1 Tax=Pantoea ananas TaxID=553 RepID=UPI00061C358E|nr:YqaA family protein [Pantoea ananatis]PQK86226.1 DedA family protein [Pantoea ananatis]PQK93708.1 DedA family protein [Pantoea ananatis]PQL01896.1 DedA family protein [Pantoea ananatis]PVY80670.1 membrane protein YqaA with SNARE-associated domain [Pantoea ananatis]PWV90204.1 membrane protein YqaA with SNARE-associated domain [Pantoea ananatis]
MSETLAYVSLLSSSFLSATLLPGSSEALLVALLIAKSASVYGLILVASLGNTLGGLTNIILGRLLPLKRQGRWHETAMTWLQRLGPAALLFSWLPIVGDLLCVLAGWLRFGWLPSILFLAIGKTLRYIVIATATLQGMEWWH